MLSATKLYQLQIRIEYNADNWTWQFSVNKIMDGFMMLQWLLFVLLLFYFITHKIMIIVLIKKKQNRVKLFQIFG